ncbi:MAG: DUF4150 domain-containing protein [Myxococcales bacterium]|nr:DUF4150 domain-containing protein [Myxococcales bacterium]
MGKDVFANGMAISAAAGDGKLIAAFPDVCNSPPSPPAGPLPLPYPNSAFSKDLKDGSKRVSIGGKPAGLKGSHFKSSPLGDEAATRTFGGSLLSHTITGKAYFAAYSMDVKIEGQNAPRHLDLMTSNHGSYPGSTPPFTEMEEMALLALAEAKPTCPCCLRTEDDCAAALPKEIKPGVPREPLSFREYYNLDETDASGALTPKAKSRRDTLKDKPCAGGKCPNAGKAERKSDPPCDVYRVTTKEEGDKNFNKGMTDKRLRELRKIKGVPANKSLLAQDVLGSWKEAQDLRAAGWTEVQMNKAIQIDHTTPRTAGGCPTSEENTQAHGLKCGNCKDVDGQLDTWHNQELSERRAALGL